MQSQDFRRLSIVEDNMHELFCCCCFVEILLFVVVTGGDEACNTRVGVWFAEFAQHALHVLLPHDWPILCY